MTTRLFLIGPRGSGKSTVAAALAPRLGWDWVDADGVIEERMGCPIRDAFARGGEGAFRQVEATVLAELCERERVVVATGGGVVLSAENRERMRRSGAVVWLRASPEALWARVVADATTDARRPNLAGGGIEEMRQVVAAREELYRPCAHLAVETEGRSPRAVADEVLVWWGGRAANR